MERAKLLKPTTKLTRQKLQSPPSSFKKLVDKLIDPMTDEEWDNKPVTTDHLKRIAELEHEIRMIQASARDVIRSAEREATRIAEAAAKRRHDKIIVEMELDLRNLRAQLERLKQANQNNITPGTQYCCPHCGVVSDGPDEEDELDQQASSPFQGHVPHIIN